MIRLFAIFIFVLSTVHLFSQTYTVHFLNPWADDPVFQDGALYILGSQNTSTASGPLNWHPGSPMEKEAIGDWYKVTFTKMPDLAQYEKGKFAFRIGEPPNFNSKMDFDSTGITAKSSQEKYFEANELFRIESPDPIKEVWIYLDATGKVIITDVAPDAKLLMLYNPWPASAPLISVGGAPVEKMRMATRTKGDRYCNWFQYWFSSGQKFTVHFTETLGKTLIWGLAGSGDNNPIDLTALYATTDTVFLFPGRKPAPDDLAPAAPKMQTSFPKGFEGICSYDFGFTIRDFSPDGHPDFYLGMVGQFVTKKLVENTLGPDNKPVLSALGKTKIKQFDWFSEAIPDNYTKCIDLPMKKTPQGYWTFDSYYDTHEGETPNPSFQFFPIDDWNPHGDPLVDEGNFPKKVGSVWPAANLQWGQGRKGVQHNNNFCMEGHATFKYVKGQIFTFSGDDDVWVYIDNILMIDLGWMHIPKIGAIYLDQVAKFQNWEVNSQHKFDIFYCDRNSPGSNIMMETSIYFEQVANFFADLVRDPTSGKETYDIKQRTGGEGNCRSIGTGNNNIKIEPASANIVLEHPDGKIDSLHKSNPYQNVGLFVNASAQQIVIDTAALNLSNEMPPGTYKIVLINRDRPVEREYLYFTVQGSHLVNFKNPPQEKFLEGTLVPITIASVDAEGNFIKRPTDFQLTSKSGLLIFSDPAGTLPILPTTMLKTDAATGELLVYVTIPKVVVESKGPITIINPNKPPPNNKGNSHVLTFYVPGVTFPPPIPSGLAGDVLKVTIASKSDSARFRKQAFSLIPEAPLVITLDSAGTQPYVAGTLLETDSISKTKVVWVRVPNSFDTSASLVLIATYSDKKTESARVSISFVVPKLQFTDATGAPLNTAELPGISHKTIRTGQHTFVQVTYGGSLCETCNPVLNISTKDPNLKFKLTSTGQPVTQIKPAKGKIDFFVYTTATPENFPDSIIFTLTGPTKGTEITWSSPLVISYLVVDAWMHDADKDGAADLLHVKVDDVVDTKKIAALKSVNWPVEEGPGIDVNNNGGNFTKISDSVFAVAVGPFEFGATAIPAGGIQPTFQMVDLAGNAQTATIKDAVGPVVTSVKFKSPQYRLFIYKHHLDTINLNTINPKKIKPKQMADTLVISFSEPIKPADLAYHNTFNYQEGCRTATDKTVPVEYVVWDQLPGEVHFPISPSSEVNIDDCLGFSSYAAATDLFGNGASQTMQKIQGKIPPLDGFKTKLVRPILGGEHIINTGYDYGEFDMPALEPILVVDSIKGAPVIDANNEYMFHRDTNIGLTEEWIPPNYMLSDGSMNPNALSCPEVVPTKKQQFPENCISAVAVISEGSYTAEIAIFDHLGKFIHKSIQKFGCPVDLAQEEERLLTSGYLSYLVWNQKDMQGKKVGTGVYIWKVKYTFANRRVRGVTYRQGIADVRPEEDRIRNCAIME